MKNQKRILAEWSAPYLSELNGQWDIGYWNPLFASSHKQNNFATAVTPSEIKEVIKTSVLTAAPGDDFLYYVILGILQKPSRSAIWKDATIKIFDDTTMIVCGKRWKYGKPGETRAVGESFPECAERVQKNMQFEPGKKIFRAYSFRSFLEK